jgi:hypothetical protein
MGGTGFPNITKNKNDYKHLKLFTRRQLQVPRTKFPKTKANYESFYYGTLSVLADDVDRRSCVARSTEDFPDREMARFGRHSTQHL